MFAWHYYKKHHKIERKTATSPNTHKYAHGYIKKCLCISKLILDEIMQQSSHFLFIANTGRPKKNDTPNCIDLSV